MFVNIEDVPKKHRVSLEDGVTYYKVRKRFKFDGRYLVSYFMCNYRYSVKPHGYGIQVDCVPTDQRINFRNFAKGFGNSELTIKDLGMWSNTGGTLGVPAVIPVSAVQLIAHPDFSIVSRYIIIPRIGAVDEIFSARELSELKTFWGTYANIV